MENKQFGCEALNPAELQEINGGGYINELLRNGKISIISDIMLLKQLQSWIKVQNSVILGL